MNNDVPLTRYTIFDGFVDWATKRINTTSERVSLQANDGEEIAVIESLGYELVDQWSTIMEFTVSLWRLSGPDGTYILIVDNVGDRAFFYCQSLRDLCGLLSKLDPVTTPK